MEQKCKEQKCNKCAEVKVIKARNLCNSCYYLEWYHGEGTTRNRKKLDICIQCNREMGSLTEKGKELKRGNATLCKTCYSKDYKSRKTDICSKCNIKMSKPTIKGLCNFCINEIEEQMEGMDVSELKLTGRQQKRRNTKKEMPVNIAITKKQREEIRRLLAIYKNGLQTLAEPFRLVSLYVELYSDVELDSYTEESQVIIVLRTFKKLFDAPFIELEEKPKSEKKYKAENPYAAAKRRLKYQQNKEKVAAYMKQWRENNADKIEAYKKRKK